MNLEEIRDFCLNFEGVTEEMPFGPETVVFKVMGKMFLLFPLDVENVRISIKNTPEKNIELRGDYPNIVGAFHMNKTHWNSLIVDFSTKKDLVKLLITESYDLVVKGLTKKLQLELSQLGI
jgi:predicted DNA-binding protein (MmcQ/YjbR family)